MPRCCRPLLLAAAALVLSRSAVAQRRFPPDSFTNLKVLPKNIDQRTLLATMRGFAMALGVRCAYCHVAPREDAPLDSIDFAKDDKRTKRAARVMLDMVHHINDEHLADVPDREIVLTEVARSEARAGRLDNAIGLLNLNAEFNPTSAQIPAALGDVMLQKGDTAAAIAQYRTAVGRDSTFGLARMRLRQLTGGPGRRP
ncbi:MAG: c-type cytochrome [Gemmatimonadetes bacterium]|nr:MAG: c-type cytochrome [Gemmatimonadota bacterium]